MRRRPVRARALAVIVGILAAGLVAPSAHADGVADQQQQVKADLAEIQRLEQKSSQLNEQYLGYMNDKAALEAEIATGQVQINAQSAQVLALQTQLASIAVQQFTGGGASAFSLLGDTSSATDGLQREQLVRAAVNAGAASADDYDAQLQQLNDAQASLTAKQDKVSKLAEQAAATLAQTEQAGQAYQDELAKDQALLGDLLVQEQQRQLAQAAADHAAAVAKAQAADKASQDKAAADQAARDQAAQDQAAQDQAARAAAAGSGSSANGSNGSSPSTSSPSAPPASAGKSGGTTSSTNPPIVVVSPVTSPPSDGGSSGASADSSVATDPAAASNGSGSDSGSSPSATPDTTSVPDAVTAPPVSSRAQIAVAAAKSQLGVRYQYAMSSPGVAFDCSGLTSYAWAQAGVSIPHQSGQQYASTPHVALTDLAPGDLLYYYSPISHVAMYIGNGQVIQAPAPGKFVEIVGVNWRSVVGASRPG